MTPRPPEPSATRPPARALTDPAGRSLHPDHPARISALVAEDFRTLGYPLTGAARRLPDRLCPDQVTPRRTRPIAPRSDTPDPARLDPDHPARTTPHRTETSRPPFHTMPSAALIPPPHHVTTSHARPVANPDGGMITSDPPSEPQPSRHHAPPRKT